MLSDDELDAALQTDPAMILALMSGGMTAGEFKAALRRLARAVERAAYERAAQECEAQISGSDYHYFATHGHWDHMAQAATNCAAAIRALGGNDGN